MTDAIKIYEVGPRDGLQNEAIPVTTAQKKQMVAGLVAAGLTEIELTSFVHPKAVPQMADADTVMATAVADYPHLKDNFVGLVFNQIGYDRALAAGARSLAFGVAVSNTFSQNNTRRTTEQAIATTRNLMRQARRDGLWTRIYLITAWVCPFEGPVNSHKTLALAEEMMALQPDELAFGDTIGHANPLDVGHLMEQAGRRLGMAQLAVHLHDTQALGLANATAAIQAGVRIIDSAIGGLGGCPFAPGAAGNLATEDLVFLLYKMGYGTGIDFAKLWDVVTLLEGWMHRPLGGRIRPWWESTHHDEPEVVFN